MSVSQTITQLKEKMKIPEPEQKMICPACIKYYLVQIYVRDQDKYFSIPEFICLNCNYRCDIDELGESNIV